MAKSIIRALLGVTVFLGSGCAAVRSTEQVVVRYNEAFAQSRNEIMLLNVLRAAAREPLQFSTMGTVSGSIGNSASITIPFTNVIAGGRDAISPSIQIQDAVNPSVTIVPLATEAFVTGILTPVGPDKIELFLHSGWDAAFLLPLVVGGVVCPDERLLLNSGEYVDGHGGTGLNDAFMSFFHRSALQFALTESPANPADGREFLLTDEQTVALLRQGAGDNRTISVGERSGDRRRVTIQPAAVRAIEGMAIAELCSDPRTAGVRRNVRASTEIYGAFPNRPTREGLVQGRVIFRSVAAIFHYLGESHRIRYRADSPNARGLVYFNMDGRPQTLFRVEWAPDARRRAVATRFHDETFWIPAIDLRSGEGDDRTLKTLSFLDQLIALQTRDSVITGTQPLVVVGQR